MARIIDFYIPARYNPQPKKVPSPEGGKLIQFLAAATKQSA
jgi:hypothetical protein